MPPPLTPALTHGAAPGAGAGDPAAGLTLWEKVHPTHLFTHLLTMAYSMLFALWLVYCHVFITGDDWILHWLLCMSLFPGGWTFDSMWLNITELSFMSRLNQSV